MRKDWEKEKEGRNVFGVDEEGWYIEVTRKDVKAEKLVAVEGR